MAEGSTDRQVWLYEGGEWHYSPGPIDWHDGDDVRARYEEAGYTSQFRYPFLGLLPDEDMSPAGAAAGLSLWCRPGRPPECIIGVQGTDGATHELYVTRLPDALDLMARWAPIVNTGTLMDVLSEIYAPPVGVRGSRAGDGLIELIARRAARARADEQ